LEKAIEKAYPPI
jgi:dephospho-CoA kinase